MAAGFQDPNALRILAKMKSDWNKRAGEDGARFIATINAGTESDFHESGGRDVYYLFRHLEHLLHPQQAVLDIGCGIGRMDAHVAPRVRKLVGIDVSGSMIAGARARLGHLGNVEFLEGEGVTLRPLPDASFDVVFSHIVFQHMPREAFELYLVEVFRVLRPGGSFVFQIPEAVGEALPDPALDDTFELRFHREDGVRFLLERAGLRWESAARFRVNTPDIVFDQLRIHARRPLMTGSPFDDQPLIEALKRGLESEGRRDAAAGLGTLVAEGVNPLGGRGWRLGDAGAAALGRALLGGAGPVFRAGDRSALGPTRARQTILIHVTTKCVLDVELWLPFATAPCGAWRVTGPGPSEIALVPEGGSEHEGLVEANDFGVLVALGREGEFPSWVTFGP